MKTKVSIIAGQMALSYIGSAIWSKVPETLKQSKTTYQQINTFKDNLNEHFFKKSKNSNSC